MFIFKNDLEINCNRNTGELKIKILFNESNWSTIIPDKFEKHGFKKYNYIDILFNHLEESNNYYINYKEEFEHIILCIDDLYFSNNKRSNICEKLYEKFDLEELEQDPNNVELLKKIIIRQNKHILHLNTKIDELSDKVENY